MKQKPKDRKEKMREYVLEDLLIQAIKDNDTKRVLDLIEHGADPNSWSCYKIGKRWEHGRIYSLTITKEMAKILLFHCEDRKEFLHEICTEQSFNYIKDIFDSVFRPELTKEEATSALTGILENRWQWKEKPKKCFAFLSEIIDAGADLNFLDEYCNDALNHAIEMCSHVGIPNKRRDGISENLCISIIDFLLKKGAKINNPEANSVLCRALHKNSAVISLFLLDKGANPNKRSHNGEGSTPLMAAVRVNKEIVQTLLAKGAEINATDNFGHNALYYLIWWRKEETTHEIFQILIQNGIHLDNIDNNGDNIISYIIEHQEYHFIDLLLETSFDFDYSNDDILGRTLLIRFLDALYNTNRTVFEDEVFQTIKKIVKAGVDVNKEDKYGRTPLIIAAKHAVSKRDLKLIRLLIKNGVDLNKQDVYGKTAYDYARKNHFLKKKKCTEFYFTD